MCPENKNGQEEASATGVFNLGKDTADRCRKKHVGSCGEWTMGGQDGSREGSKGCCCRFQARDDSDGGLHRVRQWRWKEGAGCGTCSGLGLRSGTGGILA